MQNINNEELLKTYILLEEFLYYLVNSEESMEDNK